MYNSTVHRCAFVSPGWPPSEFTNGIVSYSDRIASQLRDMGIDAHIITGRIRTDAPPKWIHDIQPLNKYSRKLRHLFQYNKLVYPRILDANSKALQRAILHLSDIYSFDIVQMEESFGNARLLNGRLRPPLVVRLHGPWFLVGKANRVDGEPGYKVRVANERLAILSADAITSPSTDVLEQTRRELNDPLKHARVIHNPITTAPHRERWSFTNSSPGEILFVGRFDSVKGGDIIIRAFESVCRRSRSTRLTFVGPDKGVYINGDTVGIHDYIDRYCSPKTREQIRVVGPKTPPEINALRRHASVVVMASRYETLGNVTLEALAMGCPLVGTAVGGTNEIITDGTNGLLADPEDPESLAAKILILLKNRDLAARIGAAAVDDVEKRFHPRVIAQQTIDFYRETIARHRG